jgi:hypothetical protein
LTRRLQRLCQDNSKEWDDNLDRAKFAYLAHHNQRFGQSPFYLTYGTEPIPPSEENTTPNDSPLSAAEFDEMQQRCQLHVQNLGKYRTDAAQKHRDAFSRIADKHDDYFDKAITVGDLVMRKPINLRNKL